MLPADHRPNDPLATERDFNGDPATMDDRVDRVPAQRRTPISAVITTALAVLAVIALIIWLT